MSELVAVYGTLRKGWGNHRSMKDAKGKFVGQGKTRENYNLYSLGPFPAVSMANTDNETPVVVEVYRVEKEGLTGPLDGLEGYPGFYNRTKVDVVLEGDNQVEAWLYHIDREQGSLIEGGDWNEI